MRAALSLRIGREDLRVTALHRLNPQAVELRSDRLRKLAVRFPSSRARSALPMDLLRDDESCWQ